MAPLLLARRGRADGGGAIGLSRVNWINGVDLMGGALLQAKVRRPEDGDDSGSLVIGEPPNLVQQFRRYLLRRFAIGL